jgi:hypothetical protein
MRQALRAGVEGLTVIEWGRRGQVCEVLRWAREVDGLGLGFRV